MSRTRCFSTNFMKSKTSKIWTFLISGKFTYCLLLQNTGKVKLAYYGTFKYCKNKRQSNRGPVAAPLDVQFLHYFYSSCSERELQVWKLSCKVLPRFPFHGLSENTAVGFFVRCFGLGGGVGGSAVGGLLSWFQPLRSHPGFISTGVSGSVQTLVPPLLQR